MYNLGHLDMHQVSNVRRNNFKSDSQSLRSTSQARLRDLKQAEALVFKYLDTCEKLDLLDRADSQAWQAMLKEGEHSAPQALQAKGREQKIERFR